MGLKIDEHDPRRFVLYNEGEEVPLIQEFAYYRSMVGDNLKDTNRASGAYIFRPNGVAIPVCDKQTPSERISGQSSSLNHYVVRLETMGYKERANSRI